MTAPPVFSRDIASLLVATVLVGDLAQMLSKQFYHLSLGLALPVVTLAKLKCIK